MNTLLLLLSSYLVFLFPVGRVEISNGAGLATERTAIIELSKIPESHTLGGVAEHAERKGATTRWTAIHSTCTLTEWIFLTTQI